MSVQAGAEFEALGWKFEGLSLSGIRTSITVPSLSVAFDVAQGFPFVLTMKQFFLSHGHLDHAAGVPYILSQKAMTGQPKPRFYMPPSLVEPLTGIIRLWEQIEKHEYDFEFIGVKPDENVRINDKYFVRAFPTVHRVDSYGYTVFESRKRLAERFRGIPREELMRLAREGENLNEVEEIPWISFTGDTTIEFLDQRPWIAKSKILFLESTYLDERKTIANAREWGHSHLDEIIARLDDIESEKIVLIHVSSRYSTEDAKNILRKKIPPRHLDRIELFPGR